jgi:cobalt/nickel transport system permease protein
LQRLDPRVKVVTLFAVLVSTGFVRHIPVLLGIYAVSLALAVASRVSVGFFVKRVWLFVPIFTGVIVLPATLNIVTHGQIVVPLGSWFGHHVGMTRQGLTAAGLIVSRVATSISLVVLVTITTPWTKLLAALRGLYVARMVILVLGIAYRYLFHLLSSVTDMYTARAARTVALRPARGKARRRTGVDSGRRFVAASAGALFGKAQSLSDEVYTAMLARGYRGDARSIETFRIRVIDVGFAVACVAVVVTTAGLDRVLGHG